MDTQALIESVRSGTLAVIEDNPHYRIFDCTVKAAPAWRLLVRSSVELITLGQPMLEFMETGPLHQFAEDHGIERRDATPLEVYVFNWVARAQGPMVFDVGFPVDDACEPPVNDHGFIVKDYPAMKVASIVYEGPFPHEPMSGWGNIEWERRAREKGLVYTERVYRELYHACDFEGHRHITEIQLEIE
jgi:hypothetical protein